MKVIRFITLFLLINCLVGSDSSAEVNDSKLLEDSVNDMYVVAGSGLGGAVIGLSTLSFASEPGDHLKNILVGASLGVIGGVAFVGYSTANKGRDMYYDASFHKELKKEFSSSQRVAWHQLERKGHKSDGNKSMPFLFWGSSF